MALQTRGIFGAPMQPDRGLMTPGLGAPMQAQQPPMQPPKRDKTRHIAGIIADALAGLNGQGPIYAPMAQRRREMEWREQQEEVGRQRDNQDWFQRESWKMANAPPPRNDTVEDYEFWKRTLPPEQFGQWVQNRVNPPQWRAGPDGRFYRMETADSAPQTLGGTLPEGWKIDEGGGASNGTGMFP